jgi:hypothetical protein
MPYSREHFFLTKPNAFVYGVLAILCLGSSGMHVLGRWSQCLAKVSWFTTSHRVIWNRYILSSCTTIEELNAFLHTVAINIVIILLAPYIRIMMVCSVAMQLVFVYLVIQLMTKHLSIACSIYRSAT